MAAAISWQNKAGFCWQKTLAYTSKQNGRAECTIRMIRGMMITMMCMHHLPQTFWPFAATATAFMKNLLLNIKNRIPYHIFYDKDPWKSFSMLHTFGCLAWVNIPKAKCKKLGELAIPTIFVGYDKEHKGWTFLAPSYNPPIFWSNSTCFLQDKSWNDRTDTIPIQDMDALHYNDLADIENLGYDTVDEHDEELQQPLDNIYCPPPEPDTAFEGDSSPLDPQAPLSNTKTMRWTIGLVQHRRPCSWIEHQTAQ